MAFRRYGGSFHTTDSGNIDVVASALFLVFFIFILAFISRTNEMFVAAGVSFIAFLIIAPFASQLVPGGETNKASRALFREYIEKAEQRFKERNYSQAIDCFEKAKLHGELSDKLSIKYRILKKQYS